MKRIVAGFLIGIFVTLLITIHTVAGGFNFETLKKLWKILNEDITKRI